MPKILLPMDGSDNALRAIEHVIALQQSESGLDIHLIAVPIAVDSGHARMFVNHAELEDYYREEGETALAEARRRLDQAGVAYSYHIVPGHIAETIARFAEEHRFDGIIMGTHGRGGLKHLLLGSVATDVIKLTALPVTLVK
jgi:nucleotide-binding universal stress UspA family protein